MKQIFANERSILPLGRCGENLARQVVFDLAEWISQYGSGTAELIYQRPGDERPHIMEIEQNDPMAIWNITAYHTATSEGGGQCELRWYVGEVLTKSRAWRTYVEPALDTTCSAPEDPEQGWVDQVLQAGANAQISEANSKDYAEQAEAAARRAENAAGSGDSGEGGSGDGFSYKLGTGLKVTDNDTLEVDSAKDFEGDNDRPASAALVKAQLGNIEAWLATI